MNYFEVFDLPRLLNIDTRILEKQFHDLSRQYHPDYFTSAPSDEKARALRMTALLNDAYRTLRHPTRRVEYLLSLYGMKPDGSKVPKSLLMEVFEINEQLEDLKARDGSKEELEALRHQIVAKRTEFERQLQEAIRQWDSLIEEKAGDVEMKDHLEKLTEILSESSYIRNLEEEIEGRKISH
jgi:molecular chaperone HscB